MNVSLYDLFIETEYLSRYLFNSKQVRWRYKYFILVVNDSMFIYINVL